MKRIQSYKVFESYQDVKSVLRDIMDDIEDEFGFDCLYHNGYGWSYPCDLALVVPLQGNVLYSEEDTIRHKTSSSISVEKIKQKYDLIYRALNNNKYLENNNIKIVGSMVYFKERANQLTFCNPKFLSWDEFVDDVTQGDYIKSTKKTETRWWEVNHLVILFKYEEN